MDHPTHPVTHETHHEPTPPPEKSITLRIPKPNWQVTALVLIALIAGLQTIQLVRLKNSVSAKTLPAAATTTTTAAPAAASDIPAQVGGC